MWCSMPDTQAFGVHLCRVGFLTFAFAYSPYQPADLARSQLVRALSGYLAQVKYNPVVVIIYKSLSVPVLSCVWRLTPRHPDDLNTPNTLVSPCLGCETFMDTEREREERRREREIERERERERETHTHAGFCVLQADIFAPAIAPESVFGRSIDRRCT